MVLVNDTWFEVYDLQDISKIIRDIYNYDLADEMDKLLEEIPKHTDAEFYSLDCALEDAINEIEDYKDEINGLNIDVSDLKEEIDQLNKEKDELKARLRELESR